MRTGAEINGDYRYKLWRWWSYGFPCVFVMLNPSTANFVDNDPTIRRCINFSRMWGYAGTIITNLFALRSTDPKNLYTHPSPIGFRNDDAIDEACQLAGRIVVAWGDHGSFMNRGDLVLAALRAQGHEPMCFGKTKAGQPRHPLYQPNNSVLEAV